MKKQKTLLSMIVAFIMCASLFAGCDSTGTQGNGETNSGDNEKILRYQVSTVIDTMDVTLSNDGTGCGVLSQCMIGLYTKDANGAPVLGVAKSVDKAKDGLSYTFKIRDDALWSNGDHVTAKDFVFSWRRAADPATASDYQFFIQTACIKNGEAVTKGEKKPEELGVEAKDDKTLVVTLDTPCPIFENLMSSMCFMPIEQSFFEKCGDKFGTSPETINCNGPFKVSEYEPSTLTIRTVKNDKFYDAGKVKLDGIEFKVIMDSQSAALSYDKGDLDVVTLTGSLIDQYSADPNFSTRSDGYSWFVEPNMTIKGLENANIRKALAKSVDKKAITEKILKDGSAPMDYVVPSGLASSSSGTDFRKAAGDAYDSFTYNVEDAQKLWATGLSELGVSSLKYSLLCDDTESAQAVAQFMQNEWQTNLKGLTIQLQVLPKKARLEAMKKGEYDLGLTRWGPDYADPMTYLDMWVTDASSNCAKWSNAEYDSIIDSAKYGKLALNIENRWDELIGCEKTLADDCVILPMYGQSVAVMMNPKVTGIQFYSLGSPYLFLNVDIK